MPTRYRTRSRVATRGYVRNMPAGTIYATGSNAEFDKEQNWDTTMPRPYTVDHPLTIDRRRALPPLRVNGSVPYTPGTSSPRLQYENYNPPNRTGYAYAPSPSAFDEGYWKTKALANLNPYRPTVDIPLFLWELKDLPRMVQHAGWLLKGLTNAYYRHHWKDLGSLYLAYQFGWAALVRDVLGMFDFTRQIENRKRYLRSLERGDTFRRTLYSGIVSSSVTPNGYSLSAPWRSVVVADIERTYRLKVWFTANAKLQDTLPGDDRAFITLSRDLVMGMSFQPERVWDFIPWTWLIDYFANIGDYLEAHGTNARVKVTRMNLMATRVDTSKLVNVRPEAGLTCSHSELVTEIKKRYVYSNPTPSVHLTPFITQGQMAIIGALSATRAKRAIR